MLSDSLYCKALKRVRSKIGLNSILFINLTSITSSHTHCFRMFLDLGIGNFISGMCRGNA